MDSDAAGPAINKAIHQSAGQTVGKSAGNEQSTLVFRTSVLRPGAPFIRAFANEWVTGLFCLQIDRAAGSVCSPGSDLIVILKRADCSEPHSFAESANEWVTRLY